MKASEILAQHKLKRTNCRQEIISAIMCSKMPLSEQEISERLLGQYDRTTLYRAFKTLEQNHILHKIVVDNYIIKYALNISETIREEHAHFYCNLCNNLICLENLFVPQLNLPDGYQNLKTELIIKGICPSCKQKSI